MEEEIFFSVSTRFQSFACWLRKKEEAASVKWWVSRVKLSYRDIRIDIITDDDDDEETSVQSVTSHLFTTSIRWTCRNNLTRVNTSAGGDTHACTLICNAPSATEASLKGVGFRVNGGQRDP